MIVPPPPHPRAVWKFPFIFYLFDIDGFPVVHHVARARVPPGPTGDLVHHERCQLYSHLAVDLLVLLVPPLLGLRHLLLVALGLGPANVELPLSGVRGGVPAHLLEESL